ncbi:nuclear transport factor 2 family protein [Pseudoteredinibacter isoporae]|uniref:nuclear transport factor 2 family protein n=1 Tax=Pseudoteredinibacter isoporae TaxID=570281 RepID=UPI0031098932
MLRLLLLCCCTLTAYAQADAQQAVNNTLDRFHQYAAEANGQAYFELMSDDMVYLGTDASERWSKSDFKAYALPYFNKGRGWLYTAQERHIILSADGTLAWFDELLNNEKYGVVRGSGVLSLTKDGWRLRQYNLAFPIPNALAGEFTARMKQHGQTP